VRAKLVLHTKGKPHADFPVWFTWTEMEVSR